MTSNGREEGSGKDLSFFFSPPFLSMTKKYINPPKTSSITFFLFLYIYTYIGDEKFLVQQKEDG